MRNLKRALSLTLASVMLLGMMVVGSSAAAGYDDVKETDNVEAIEVLQAVEVMVGDERGFGPDRPVSRAEMAVVMGKLLNLDYNYYVSTCPFTDVSGNYDWARGWVGACAANGIVSGRGNGVYDPAATVTAVEAASMMMRALGYFKYTEDYADGFVTATVRQGSDIGIFDGVGTDGTTPMTRNQVAQMALNALRSEMVTFTGTPGINVNGVNVSYRAEYTPRTSTENKYNTIEGRTSDVASDYNHKGQYYIQLGEQLYDGKLKLYSTVDVFGRPARQWEYDAEEIGTYVKTELLRKEYTAEVTGKELYNLLTKSTIDKYDFTISIDGIEVDDNNAKTYLGDAWFTEANLVNTNTKGIGKTGNGVLTQVFVDTGKDEQMVYISIINTYLAKAVDDYKTNKEEADFTVWSVDNKGSRGDMVLVKDTTKSEVMTVKNEDIVVEDVKEDDIYLVWVADGEIQEIYTPEVIEKTEISAFKNGDWINASGTKYDYASAIQYDTEVLDEYDDKNMKDTVYMVYLDMYGYAIGVEIVDDAEDYVFLTGIDLDTSNLYNKTADGNVIHTDGTMETVRIDMDKSRNAYNEKFASPTGNHTGVNSLMNTWCTYSVDGKGVYTLTEVANDEYSFTSKFTGDTTKLYTDTEKRQNDKLGQGHNSDAVTLDKAHAGLDGIKTTGFKTVHANDDSVFLTVKTEYIIATDVLSNREDTRIPSVIINDVDNVDTGIQNVDLKAYTAAQVKASNDKYANVDERDVSHGVYTLFKDNGYVVAAVVVGEDDGASSNYAYITGTVKQESYDKEKDEWTWSIDAIVNGEQVVLEEKGSRSDYLKYMAKGEWYEIKYNSDGDVRRATEIVPEQASMIPHASNAYIFCESLENKHVESGYPKFIGDMAMKEASYDAGNNTIVLYHDLTAKSHVINAKGRTLQIETNIASEHRDLTVTSSSKIVLVQDVEKVDNAGNRYGVTIMDRIENCGEGQNGLKKAVDWLEDNNNFYGYVGAIIENGVATSVIIWDRTAYEINIGGGYVKPTGDARLVWNDEDKDNQYWDLFVPAKYYHADMTTDEVADWLVKAGCTDISKTRTGWNFTRNGMNYENQAVVVRPENAKYYDVDVVKGVNGTVSADYTSALEGTTVTVTAKADKGYEAKEITVKADVKVTIKNTADGVWTFTMPASDVEITVTFKKTETPVGEKATVAFAEDDKNLAKGAQFNVLNADGTDYATEDEIRVGQKIRLDPAVALTVTDGSATKNDDGTWTINKAQVTIKAASGYSWQDNAFGKHGWLSFDTDGSIVQNDPAKPYPTKTGRFSIARAIGDKYDADEDYYSTIKENGNAFRAVVTMGEDTVAWIGYYEGEKLIVKLDVSEGMPDVDVAFDSLDYVSNPEYTTVTEIAKPGTKPEEPSDDIYIEAKTLTAASGKVPAQFFVWLNGKDSVELTPEQMAEALAKVGFTTTADDFSKVATGYEAKAKTSEGADVIITIASAQTKFEADNPVNLLFKVTFEGTDGETVEHFFKNAGGAFVGVPKEVKQVMPSNATCETVVTSGKYYVNGEDNGAASVVAGVTKTVGAETYQFTVPNGLTKDVTYVEAIEVEGFTAMDKLNVSPALTGSNAGKVLYQVKIELTPGHNMAYGGDGRVIKYVQAGTKLTLVEATAANKATVTNGQEITITVDGETKKFVVGKDGKIPTVELTVERVADLTASNVWKLSSSLGDEVDQDTLLEVWLGDDKLEPKTKGGKVYEIGGMKGLGLAKQDKRGDWVALSTPIDNTAADDDGWVEYTAVAADAIGGKITLAKAYVVKTGDLGTQFSVYSTEDAAVADAKTSHTAEAAQTLYYPVSGESRTVFIEDIEANSNKGTDLMWADEKKAQRGISDILGNNYAPNGTDRGVWEVEVIGSITTGSEFTRAFVTHRTNGKVEVTPNSTKFETGKKVKDVAVKGVLLTTGVKIESATLTGDEGQTFDVEWWITDGGAGFSSIQLDITLKSGKEISGAGKYVGQIEFVLSTGGHIILPVSIAT